MLESGAKDSWVLTSSLKFTTTKQVVACTFVQFICETKMLCTLVSYLLFLSSVIQGQKILLTEATNVSNRQLMPSYPSRQRSYIAATKHTCKIIKTESWIGTVTKFGKEIATNLPSTLPLEKIRQDDPCGWDWWNMGHRECRRVHLHRSLILHRKLSNLTLTKETLFPS